MIGWTYESDETAISSALENLESLNTQKQQDDLQYQIEQLERDKKLLEDLDKQAQKEANEEALKSFFDGANIGQSGLVQALVNGYADNRLVFNTGTGEVIDAKGNVIAKIGGVKGAAEGKERDYDEAAKKLQGAVDFVEILPHDSEGVFSNWGVSDKDFIERYDALDSALEAAVAAGVSGKVVEAAQKYIRANKKHRDELKSKEEEADKNATGTFAFSGGRTFVNEFGTEGIITPQGTLTALPSKTGIVPADITKNVWKLGEVAPTLIAQLSSLTQKVPSGNAGNTTYEEGQYIDNLTMNVYPTKDYDMDRLLMEARAKVRLTRHNN